MPIDDPRAQRPGVFLPQPTGQPPYTSQLPPGTVTAQAQSIFNTQDPNSLLAWLEQQLPGGLANFLLALIQRGVCACTSGGGTSMFWEYVGTILRNVLADTPGINQILLRPTATGTQTELDMIDDGTTPGSSVNLLARGVLFLQSVNDNVDIVADVDMRLNAGGSIVMDPSSDVTIITADVTMSLTNALGLFATGQVDIQSAAVNGIGLAAGSGSIRLNAGTFVDIICGTGAITLTPGTVVKIDKANFVEEAAATGPVGVIVGKVPIRDNAGTLIGYLPVYNAIT